MGFYQSTPASVVVVTQATTLTSTAVYTAPGRPAATSSLRSTLTTVAIPASSSSSTPQLTWTPYGCVSDLVTWGSRTLPNQITIPYVAMTNGICQSACRSSGFTFAGTEYSTECYCGNTITNGGKLLSSSVSGDSCSMTCPGNKAEWCGGSNRLSVWQLGSVSAVSGTNGQAQAQSQAAAQAPAASIASTKTSTTAAVPFAVQTGLVCEDDEDEVYLVVPASKKTSTATSPKRALPREVEDDARTGASTEAIPNAAGFVYTKYALPYTTDLFRVLGSSAGVPTATLAARVIERAASSADSSPDKRRADDETEAATPKIVVIPAHGGESYLISAAESGHLFRRAGKNTNDSEPSDEVSAYIAAKVAEARAQEAIAIAGFLQRQAEGRAGAALGERNVLGLRGNAVDALKEAVV